MPNMPPEPKGLRRAFTWLRAVARVMGLEPRQIAPRLVSCPHCRRQTDVRERDCSHCGGVVIPQSKWDTAHAPLEPPRWRGNGTPPPDRK